MTNSRIALYPGSFDPITNGHVDIIRRATCLFDQLVISIAVNHQKEMLFSIDERLAMVREEIAKHSRKMQDHVQATAFDGLLVELARTQKAQAIVRGLRSVSDFEYEFQMASMNSRLSSQVDTIFLMASDNHPIHCSPSCKGNSPPRWGRFLPLSHPMWLDSFMPGLVESLSFFIRVGHDGRKTMASALKYKIESFFIGI